MSVRHANLFEAYISLKRSAVEAFITRLQMRVGAEHGIEILPFHFVQITQTGDTFFAGTA